VNSKVQVFEVTIRVLGGLLSAHIYASDSALLEGYKLSHYDGELLDLAVDLADRLLPAFNSPTGIPYPRINLKMGLLRGETCTAGAGSLLLEFGTLSRLTGDPKYEELAKRAFYEVFQRRSMHTGLVGNTIDAETGLWTNTITGIGAGIDSFMEYAVKSYVLFDDGAYWDVWHTLYGSVTTHLQDHNKFIYKNINFVSTALATTWIDSLAAYFPGLQVLAGDIDSAIKGHLQYWGIWSTFGMLPERYNYFTGRPEIGYYPVYRLTYINCSYDRNSLNRLISCIVLAKIRFISMSESRSWQICSNILKLTYTLLLLFDKSADSR
jgi:mannosidase alpha-like ER degradation enhancer 1